MSNVTNKEPAFVESLRSLSTALAQVQRNLGEFFTLFEIHQQEQNKKVTPTEKQLQSDVDPYLQRIDLNGYSPERIDRLNKLISEITRINPEFKWIQKDEREDNVFWLKTDDYSQRVIRELKEFRDIYNELTTIYQGDHSMVNTVLKNMVIYAANYLYHRQSSYDPDQTNRVSAKRIDAFHKAEQYLKAVSTLDTGVYRLIEVQWIFNKIDKNDGTDFNIVVDASRLMLGRQEAINLILAKSDYDPNYDALLSRMAILTSMYDLLTQPKEDTLPLPEADKEQVEQIPTQTQVHVNDASQGMVDKVKEAMKQVTDVIGKHGSVSLEDVARSGQVQSKPTLQSSVFIDITNPDLLKDVASVFSGSICSQFTGKVAPSNSTSRNVHNYPHYREDLITHQGQINDQWKDGFYTDSNTGGYQFLLRLPTTDLVIISFDREIEKTRVFFRRTQPSLIDSASAHQLVTLGLESIKF
jgi:hypothetical protein